VTRPRPPWPYRILRPIAVPVFAAAFRLEVEGKELIPKKGPGILAANHRSYLDVPMLGMVTRRQLHFMAKAELWERRFSRWFCDVMGSFPVRRGEADRAALERSLELLNAGELLGLFPEGTRQEGPVIQHCQMGVAYLAQKTGSPVVPVAITGSDRAMGLGASVPRPAKIRVRVGTPLDLSMPGTRPRLAREKATAQLRAELQQLYDALREEVS
jgi:1-acyl-sn-glycerol-3-phosphate acyltransferase